MRRRAKIIGTLGPSSSTVEIIEKLIKAGLNVVRLNMSHGDHHFHENLIKNIRQVSRRLKKEVAILMDLQGPKIRVDKLKEPLELKSGEEWFIGETKSSPPKEALKKFIPTSYKDLVKDAEVGCSILFDDGLMEAKAQRKVGDFLVVKIIEGGFLKSNKGINLPDINVSAPSFTEKDQIDLFFGLSQGVDYIALSFVRRKEDILNVKYILHKLKSDIPIISKIEKPEAIENIEEIIGVTDMVMIARGDMGVEVGNHKVPNVQKKIIGLCNKNGTGVITATQMLESMIEHSNPTRAEASDVANAIWDGTDAVMLSGETASGRYPVKSVEMMNQIILEAEKIPRERPLMRNIDLSSVSAAQQAAASLMAEKNSAKWIISITQSGRSCIKLARFRPSVEVLGVTNSYRIARRLCLLWGVRPYIFQDSKEEDILALEHRMVAHLKSEGHIKNGDKIVITRGDGKYFSADVSNSIRVEIVKNTPSYSKGNEELDEVTFSKGRILLDLNACSSCQNCINICPHEIWAVDSTERKTTYINKKRVGECALDMACVEACPTGAIEILPNEDNLS